MPLVDPSPRRGSHKRPRSGVLTGESVRARVRPWAGTPHRAFLIISGGHGARTDAPSVELIGRWMDTIASWGYDCVRTNALAASVAAPFLDAGFTPAQHLTLLDTLFPSVDSGQLLDAPSSSGHRFASHHVRSTGGRRSFLSARSNGDLARSTLTVDAAAFPVEWALDRRSLCDALRATPRSHLFHVTINNEMVGFLLVGIGGDTCYIQRLAVRPTYQRSGVAGTLMREGLRWSQARGCRQAVVNTERDNVAALALYKGLGFAPMANGLTVVERSIR